MNKTTITIIVVCIAFIIIFYYRRWRKNILSHLIDEPVNATQLINISEDQVVNSFTNRGISWSLSFWIYINNWDYRYDQDKTIISWGSNCNIWLSKNSNDLNIETQIFGTKKNETLRFKGVPVQKWLYIVVSLDNRDLDLWINGRLYKSKLLGNVQRNNTSSLEVCPSGGFNGYISNLRKYSYTLPRTSMISSHNIYTQFKHGPFGLKIPVVYHLLKLLKKIKKLFRFNIKVTASIER